jgi:capsular exopolysaccharide synthesis family protein
MGKENRKSAVMPQKHSGISEERKNILKPNSSFYLQEAYKSLRTNVNFSLADTEGGKVILITSASQGEGKSLTALNLAISFAQTDCSVLIIDCDLRRPKLNRLMNISAPAGISNVIMNPSFFDVALMHDEKYGIDVLSSGDIPPNPSELLASAKTQKLMEQLRRSYDYIILDTPPIGVVTDAAVLAPCCDGVLFVVRENRTDRAAVMYAMEQLEHAKAKVLGFVMNGMNAKNSSGAFKKYGYAQGDYYGYGY